MRIQVVCLLLVLLAASVLSKDENLRPTYDKFKNQHINKQMNTSDCDDVMRKREIFVRKNKRNACKPVNTFILADESKVKSVCEKGTRQGKFVKSKAVFNLIACKLTNKKTKYPKCKYEGTKLSKKKILIKCINNYPVHYERDLRYCEA
ncbi:ribonuclease-like 3 [Salarias fasciatus]|uniref:Ribonuclease-like 3 n=1 Tax=Salarias fasciatus TaxID=181472 RepID=A0A672F303_SALFA|nr:ribonuclease-like 3 [Salarias fasciatus]